MIFQVQKKGLFFVQEREREKRNKRKRLIFFHLLNSFFFFKARSSSIVASSETSSSSTDPTDRQFVAKSVAMLGEYLTEHHLSLLKETLGVSEDDTFEKMSDEQKKALENAYDPRALMCARRGKKSDGEDSLTTPPTSTKEKTQKVHEKKQKETKEKLNLKSITSFFTPKR